MPTSTLELPRFELEPMRLPSEILARVGHDSPPVLPLRRRPVERTPRELRETRRQMTYHWF